MEGCQGGSASHHDQNNRKIGIQWTRVRSFSPVDGKKIEKQKLWSTHPPSWSRQERRGWARRASRRKNICIPAFQINHSTDNCLPWLNFLWLQADVDLVVSYKRLVGVKSSLLAWTATTLTSIKNNHLQRVDLSNAQIHWKTFWWRWKLITAIGQKGWPWNVTAADGVAIVIKRLAKKAANLNLLPKIYLVEVVVRWGATPGKENFMEQ